jgi:uncharacterized protein with FMN-binding domain
VNTYEQQSRKKVIATALSVVALAAGVLVADRLRGIRAEATSSGMAGSGSGTTSSTTSSGGAASLGNYKDGTYSASASYFVPHGDQSIQVTLTVKSGVVTSATVQNSESDPTSANYQEGFASEYKSLVVGQKLAGLNLAGVAGASDTTQGFDQAVSQIQSQAKA